MRSKTKEETLWLFEYKNNLFMLIFSFKRNKIHVKIERINQHTCSWYNQVACQFFWTFSSTFSPLVFVAHFSSPSPYFYASLTFPIFRVVPYFYQKKHYFGLKIFFALPPAFSGLCLISSYSLEGLIVDLIVDSFYLTSFFVDFWRFLHLTFHIFPKESGNMKEEFLLVWEGFWRKVFLHYFS